ncbi:hypothetical protein RJ639_028562 [Escallonia herrerae]|uniref:Uncharacterized protein n=1 Tax=Escallonia herrerae TaxID=1293975 RepID=A0AA88UXS4_9ASTE|nr:hypothetical protein RJ639_025124 [Escallonia herrerae]KAK3038840.1 hypothetical protein RJ639_028562 [Escallonia herrerae]
MLKVQVVSNESVKPSSPTPHDLRTYKLSVLDQLIPAPYAPLVLFYPNLDGAGHLEILERLVVLKQSLSQTLTRFYPLAGIIKDDLSLECNDEGAHYAVAEVNCHLADFLNHPDLDSIHQFLPCAPSFSESGTGDRVTNIQVNVFECGGIAIGLCISHKILDGAALNTFLKGWATTARGSEKVVYPDFSAPSLFPANDLCFRDSSMGMWGSLFKEGNWITRRFVFDASAISYLKAKVNESGLQHPTRVEVVSAFLWQCAMAASKENCGFTRPSLLTHTVNLRRRTVPNLSEYSIGNLIWVASAKCMAKYDQSLGVLHGLVDRVRKSISKINDDFVKMLRSDEGTAVMCKSVERVRDFGSKEEVDYFGFTSWCKFGFYEADFGWGKPIWVSSVGISGGSVFMNLIVLMDTRCGEGIEAWVTLDEQEMNILERNVELIALASLDPTPLEIGDCVILQQPTSP